MRKIIPPKKDNTQWHRWFAWRPVQVSGLYQWRVWWEYVERREIHTSDYDDWPYYEYRFPEAEKDWLENRRNRMAHIHAELIKIWADNPNTPFQVFRPHKGDWEDIRYPYYPDWDINYSFRVKPEPKPDIIS